MRYLIALLAAGIGGVPTSAAARATEHCNPNWGTGEVAVQAPAAARARILEIVANPTRDPDAHLRLWQPLSARLMDFYSFEDEVGLFFDPVQDTQQIAAEISADPVLAAMGIVHAYPNTGQICFSPPPPAPPVTVTEYYNRITNHYFLSSSDSENAAIDAGGAGPGWSRTGEVFRTVMAGYCWGSRPVFRFYTYGANSHFFTAHTAECGFLRNRDPGWLYEGEAFGAVLPQDGQCPAGMVGLMRLYNNRWMFNDSNHRFVTRTELRDQMVESGWTSEGVTMCLPQSGYF